MVGEDGRDEVPAERAHSGTFGTGGLMLLLRDFEPGVENVRVRAGVARESDGWEGLSLFVEASIGREESLLNPMDNRLVVDAFAF